ncbi:hypothetical protein RMN57_00280 [Kitasatospora sp. CM 4170]|uniref:Uncharacterized protein n=1 Tax=Kitasatospora aburaviensis TaxID=67265 RepID=A0ABW1F649_9ACTN|nr:hypothetical protein [Kitasatospora sp. CM 4170]WNM43246.1 hypothetical protein RMN57_00280 [Kitasatospora sp. CM 4170]
MATDHTGGRYQDPGDGADRAQDPIVERLRPDPSNPPEAVLTVTGFLGDSDRPGYRRLYLTRELDYYIEFLGDDVVYLVDLPPEHGPFPGDAGTRVSLRRTATVQYTRTRTGRPVDEFDLDVRMLADEKTQTSEGSGTVTICTFSHGGSGCWTCESHTCGSAPVTCDQSGCGPFVA